MAEQSSSQLAQTGQTPQIPPPGAPACAGCAMWVMFGKQCWYFWEGKKHCTVWTPSMVEVK